MHTDISLCNANSQRDNFIWWKGILERANWISPGSLKNPYHGERSHHVIIRFIEAHSFNLPPFSWAHCSQGPSQWLRDKREPWADNTWKGHKDLAGFVTEMEQDFVCVNNVSEWRTWVPLPLGVPQREYAGTHWTSASTEEEGKARRRSGCMGRSEGGSRARRCRARCCLRRRLSISWDWLLYSSYLQSKQEDVFTF